MNHRDDEPAAEPIDITVADLATDAEIVQREREALRPVKQSLQTQGFYAYGAFDDQRRWTINVDDESGHVDVRVGDDGFEVELWGSSPGLFSDEDNEWKRRAHERLARLQIMAIARGQLAEHQHAFWDDVDHGVGVRLNYQVAFSRAPQIGAFVREHFPEVEDVIGFVESRLSV